MELTSQSWLWIVIALGAVAFFYFRRGGFGHGGLGHGGLGRGGLGRGGHGHGGHGRGGHGHGNRDEATSPPPRVPEAAIDPVEGMPVRTADAPTSVYQGRIYYFASEDSRDRFDASPQDYATAPSAQTMERNTASGRSGRGRRGCC